MSQLVTRNSELVPTQLRALAWFVMATERDLRRGRLSPVPRFLRLDAISKTFDKIVPFLQMLPIFGGLVLGCIEADYCKWTCVLQHFQAVQDLHLQLGNIIDI